MQAFSPLACLENVNTEPSKDHVHMPKGLPRMGAMPGLLRTGSEGYRQIIALSPIHLKGVTLTAH